MLLFQVPPTSPLNTPLNKQNPPKYPSPQKVAAIKKEDIEETSKSPTVRIKRKVEFKEKVVQKIKEGKPRKTYVIRRVRCHMCKGCTRDNCDECKFCVDMVKNGGLGRLRQSCALRFCQDVSF